MRTPDAAAALIRPAQTVAICGHVNPDGDTVGSVLAMMHGLRAMGKDVQVFSQDKIPGNLSMLPGVEDFRHPAQADAYYDLMIVVDVADVDRLGECAALMQRADALLQLDHHGTNPGYAQVNSVDPSASAAALLVKEQLDVLGVDITRDIAVCLYTAIATDTGNFSFNNTTAEAFRVMGELMECELPLDQLNRRLFRVSSKPARLLLGRALRSLAFHADDRITVMTLTQRDFDECGALPEHADAIVNSGLDIEGVSMAALLRETPAGNVKASLRAVAPARVDGIASTFGGGGHPQAAGCTLTAPLASAVQQLLQAMKQAL